MVACGINVEEILNSVFILDANIIEYILISFFIPLVLSK